MALSQSHVLSTRQVPVHVNRDDVQYMSEYLKHKLATLERGQTIGPQLVVQMKTLVNQEFRLLNICKHFTEACQELVQACEGGVTVPDDVLSDKLEEVMHFCQDLQHVGQQRAKNAKEIALAEKENLKAFRELHATIEGRMAGQTCLTAASVGAVGAGVAMVAGGPIAMVAVALLGLERGLSLQQYRGAAKGMLKALESDMQEKNVPIQYIETFATNLDDAINEIVRDGQGISGRSARIKRRVDMILEEIQGLQMTAAQNLLGLSSDRALMDTFGITETRRMMLAEQHVREGMAGGA